MLQQVLNHPAARDTARQFLRFAIVGAAATAVHYTILITLKQGAHVDTVMATTAGYTVGALVSYTLNRRFTFEARPHFGKGLAKYLAVIAVGAVINAAIVAALTHAGLYYLVAQVIATGLVLIWNFAAARFLVFR